MIRCNHASFCRAIALGDLRAQSRFLRVAPLTICRLARCQAVRCRVGPSRGSLRNRCRIRGLIRRYVRLKRLVWCCCLVKQVYGALIGANTVRLNSTKEQLEKHSPQRMLRAFWGRA